MTTYPVGRVAELAGVTVRTLHHYDEIGLVVPSGRGRNDYREYSDEDLSRLQQVLLYRSLGFPLGEIARLLDDPAADPAEHLRRQSALLRERIADLERMATAVERQMEAIVMNVELTPDERFDIFGGEDPEQYAAEAEQRWGNTEAYRQSRRRTARYTADEWRAIKADIDQIEDDFATALAAAVPATDRHAMDIAERHRLSIDWRFYDLDTGGHCSLAETYLADERFTAHYERRRAGLARYVHDAILTNAGRATGPA